MIAAYPFNPYWFGYSSGLNTMIRGLHVGDRFFAANWPEESRRAFLDCFSSAPNYRKGVRKEPP